MAFTCLLICLTLVQHDIQNVNAHPLIPTFGLVMMEGECRVAREKVQSVNVNIIKFSK